MPLSWNEIKYRAVTFTHNWKDESREHAEAKSFWDDFFDVFGLSRRRVATFEEPVKKLDQNYGFIDLFWKGTLLIEHKSRGKDLDKAYSQAMDYFAGLQEHDLPRIPFAPDFCVFCTTGNKLADLHVNYEQQEEYPLDMIETDW